MFDKDYYGRLITDAQHNIEYNTVILIEVLHRLAPGDHPRPAKRPDLEAGTIELLGAAIASLERTARTFDSATFGDGPSDQETPAKSQEIPARLRTGLVRSYRQSRKSPAPANYRVFDAFVAAHGRSPLDVNQLAAWAKEQRHRQRKLRSSE